MNLSLPMATRQLDLGFVRHGARTAFDRRLFSWPFVLTRTFAFDPDRPELRSVIVQTSSGAMHGDDHLRQRLALGPGATVHLTTQGAAAVHRAHPGATTHESVELALADTAWLEYLPQPRILFPGAALQQSVEIDLAAGATLFYADAFTLHDPSGSGRLFREAGSELRLRRDGELLLYERFEIAGLPRHFSRHSAFGTLLVLAPRDADQLSAWSLELNARLAAIDGLYAAASLLPGAASIGLRLLAGELRQLRTGTDLAVAALRRWLLAAA